MVDKFKNNQHFIEQAQPSSSIGMRFNELPYWFFKKKKQQLTQTVSLAG